MFQVRKNQTNFQRGEISQTLNMRADTKVYGDGAATLTNMRLLAHGGASRRPGLRFLFDLGSVAAMRLEAFVFSEDQAYVFVFGNTVLKVLSTDGALLSTITGCAWTTAMLPQLGVTQTGDVMIVCHQTMPPQVIRRTAVATFSISAISFSSRPSGAPPARRPFHAFADSDVTLTPSALTGAITLTASAAIFAAGHIGTIFRYAGTEMEITGVTSSVLAAATVREPLAATWDIELASTDGFLVGDLIQSSRGSAKGVITEKITILGNPGLRFVMLNRAQPFEYDAAIEAFLFSDTVRSKIAAAASVHTPHAAITDWDEQAFSSVRGWPACCCFHESRLAFGGSTSLPNWIFLSDVGAFYSFSLDEVADDGAIAAEISTDQVSRLRHIVSQKHLQLYCDTAELYIPQGNEKPLTPETFSIRSQTRIGSSYVKPRPFDGTVLFCQRTGKAVREFTYNDTSLTYDAVIASVMSGHLINTPVDLDVSLGQSDIQEQYAYVVMTDGTLAVMHSNRAESLIGWTPWTTDGLFKSVRTIGDRVFVLVERASHLYLERFDLSLTVDCATTFLTTAFARSLPHLPSKTVHAVSGTLYLGEQTTDGAGLATFEWNTACDVGLGYDNQITTLPQQVDVGQGRRTGQPVRISSVTAWIVQSVTFEVQGHRLAIRSVTDDMSLPPPVKSGPYQVRLLGWDRLGQVTLTHTLPLPLTVLGLSLEVNA
jgi:hypothetical protein